MPLPDHGRDHLAAWLRFVLTPGIGPKTQRDLLGKAGLPEEIFRKTRPSLAAVAGPKAAQALLRDDPQREAAVQRALDWARAPDHHLLTLADPAYPPALLEIGDPPALLYVVGTPALLSRPGVAIVGSRASSMGGRQTARSFGAALAAHGLTIVSGLAAGIDAAAHRGALDAAARTDAAGGTVAVLGTGVDLIYPEENAALAQAIVAAGGALMSELPLGAPVRPGNFPRRNRIIAGLSRGVLVVEAAVRSGSLITARLAAEFGRDVMAIPGSIHSPLARGCHQLIKQGAKLVEAAADVLAELPGFASPMASPAASPAAGPVTRATARMTPVDDLSAEIGTPAGTPPLARRILQTAGWEPFTAETMARQCVDDGVADHAGDVAAQLLSLEFSGALERLIDGRYQRRPAA